MRRDNKNNEELSEIVKDAVAEKFETQNELAEQLGITQGNLSKKLKAPSKKFIRQLEKVGVIIPITNNRNKNIINGYPTSPAAVPLAQENSKDSERIDKLLIEIGKLTERIERLEKKVK